MPRWWCWARPGAGTLYDCGCRSLTAHSRITKRSLTGAASALSRACVAAPGLAGRPWVTAAGWVVSSMAVLMALRATCCACQERQDHAAAAVPARGGLDSWWASGGDHSAAACAGHDGVQPCGRGGAPALPPGVRLQQHASHAEGTNAWAAPHCRLGVSWETRWVTPFASMTSPPRCSAAQPTPTHPHQPSQHRQLPRQQLEACGVHTGGHLEATGVQRLLAVGWIGCWWLGRGVCGWELETLTAKSLPSHRNGRASSS